MNRIEDYLELKLNIVEWISEYANTNKIKSLSSKAENTSGWYYKYKNEIDAMNAHHGPYNLFITNSADTSSAYIKNFLSQIREN